MSLESVSGPPPPAAPRSAGLAIASLVLGILALCLSFLIVGGVLGLVGVALAWAHLRKATRARAMAGVGMGLSIFGTIAAVAFGFVYYNFYKQVRSAMDSGGGSGGEVSAWEGVLAPDFAVTTLDGKTIKLSELKGKRVVLDFWATWCPPCVKEIPHFVRLHKESSPNELVILGISSEEAAKLRPFVKKHSVNYAIASADNLPAPYSEVKSIPTTFFIDRRGIIQSVLVGYHDFEDLKGKASQKDYEGEPKGAPAESAAADLKAAERALKAVSAWSVQISGASAMTAGEWDAGASAKILVADRKQQLHVIDADGTKAAGVISLPESFQAIEIGRHKEGGPRLLGYDVWGKKVTVMDRAGKKLWAYNSALGVDGAHWGDFDGDGTDEMVVGMNGFDGLHAVSADGTRLWQHSLGNVWNQAIVPAAAGDPARIFATEAGGTVKVFDAQGKLLRSLRPGGYVSPMNAARIDGNSIQVIASAVGKGARAMALDEKGAVAWSSSSGLGHASWRGTSFACGDVDGDGRKDWCFLNARNELVLATAQGERLASVPSQKGLESLALISAQPKSKGLLVTLKGNTVQCYRFE